MFELPTLECLRCGHKWIPRKPVKPRICPKCKSPYWDVPRKKEKNEHESKKENRFGARDK